MEMAAGGRPRLYAYIKEKKSRTIIAGLVLYTLFYALYFSVSFLPHNLNTESFLGGDALGQYYPYTLEFRRCLIAFFDSLGSGSPDLTMINTQFSFGSDDFTSIYPDFLPALPYYIFLPLIPESVVHIFYGIGTILLSYVSGFSFIYMCVYFGKSPVLAGIFASFYTFCGNTFHTSMFNQRLFYMYIAFPLMIAGIDKIITKRGFLLFPLSVCWLSLSGFVFLVYTVPFVAVFALIRVYFVYPDKYFRSLGICFVKCFGALLLGIAMSAVVILPVLSDYLNGARMSEELSIDIPMLLTPDISYLTEMLVPDDYFDNIPTGICTGALPFVIYTFVQVGGSRERKWYSAVMLALVSLPLTWYGLNAFRYTVCRWGFIPGMLMTYLCVCAAGDIIKGAADGSCRKDMLRTAVVILLYGVLLSFGAAGAAVVMLCVVLLFTMLPFSGRLLDRADEHIARTYERLKETPKKLRLVQLALIAFSGIVLLVYAAYLITFWEMLLSVAVAITASAAALLIAVRFRKAARAVGCVCALCLVFTAALYMYDVEHDEQLLYLVVQPTDTELDILHNEAGVANGDGTFGRISFMKNDIVLLSKYVGDDRTVGIPGISSEGPHNEQYYNGVVRDNAALRFNTSDIYVFKSVINGDLISFLAHCGQDGSSVFSVVDTGGFSGKEPLYSLFGTRTLYAFDELKYLYGLDMVYDGSDSTDGIYLYRNRYAMPAGATYSRICGSERFGALSSDQLPFAAMNEVHLDGDPLPETPGLPDYGKTCDITSERSSRGTTSYGMECFNNTVHILDDVSDCFLYITFTGVNEQMEPSIMAQRLYIDIDRTTTSLAKIHNRISTWPWKFVNDRYTISLGYHENDVDLLEFITPFEYTDYYITAVPAAVYTAAYEDASRETLQNITVSTNTLTGDITLTEDKVLSVGLLALKGWKAYVDGERVPYYKANGLFIGIPLSAGHHDIRLEYVTAYLPEGAVVSAIATLLLIAVVIVRNCTKKSCNKA